MPALNLQRVLIGASVALGMCPNGCSPSDPAGPLNKDRPPICPCPLNSRYAHGHPGHAAIRYQDDWPQVSLPVKGFPLRPGGNNPWPDRTTLRQSLRVRD